MTEVLLDWLIQSLLKSILAWAVKNLNHVTKQIALLSKFFSVKIGYKK